MKYLCLVHFEGNALAALTPDESRRLDARSLAYDEELQAAGHFIHAQALQSSDAAVLVKVRDAKTILTDGPFTETKEQLGGFILVEARDLNEAIRLAAGIPLAEL
ncbi:MAG: YciI family protein, partial [Cucumibacter sp.]